MASEERERREEGGGKGYHRTEYVNIYVPYDFTSNIQNISCLFTLHLVSLSMSKHELRASAAKLSGVTYEQSLLASTALDPPLLSRIGGPSGFHTLSTLFYNKVFNDTSNPWFLGIFATSTKEEAIDNQYRFLVQTFGGSDLYTAKKGGRYGVRLVGRHANYGIGVRAAERWVELMDCAIEEHAGLSDEEEAKKYLKMYFRYTAFYIVVAKEYMREDQLSGGNQMDSGRVW